MRLFILVAMISCFGVLTASAQDEKVTALEGKVDGVADRVTELENTLSGLTKLKISGYIQPQWQWQDVDSLGNQVNSRNAFTIRRGRVKFVHKTGSIGYTLYPDITEAGVVMKEVFADWYARKDLTISMGAMNRPFGYEIAYSSSAREVTERSLFENRFFNGERDLGLQVAYTPKIGDIKPLIEIGIFNGTDNFATGPSVALAGSTNKMGFGSTPIGTGTYATPGGADSVLQVKTNAAVAKEGILALAANGTAIGQPAKELIGHFRVPFLLSDEFSFDIGASISMGGITEPSQVIGKYSGANGALTLTNDGKYGNHSLNNQNHTFMASNRNIIGADAQFYLSVLPMGGTIIKTELYTGQVPFYGSAKLFNANDFATLGDPVASTIYKKVFGFYAMLVQNLMDNVQLAVRYDLYDPNTDVKGSDFATLLAGRGNSVSASSGFGGDLAVNTLSLDVNVFISGSMRLMFDYDMVKTETYSKTVSGNAVTIADPKDDRFTFRMQYKF
jgi:hypothetical protein